MQKMTNEHTVASRRFMQEHHDNCSICGREFILSETTHLGYTRYNILIYVGECCSSNLKKTIVRHSYSKRVFEVPPKETKIWRYMDFSKFILLLSSRKLFFSRADKFEDQFEGAKGLKKNKKQWDTYYLKFFEDAIKKTSLGNETHADNPLIKDYPKRLLTSMERIAFMDNKTTFINCWHENENESEAMWKLYTKNMSESIAIESTYTKLHKALGKNPDIEIGRVKYIDYAKSFVDINASFWYKRKSLEHEREIRAINRDYNCNSEHGKLLATDLNVLIKSIYVSPSTQNWFTDLVKDCLKQYRLNKKVKLSSLAIEPFH